MVGVNFLNILMIQKLKDSKKFRYNKRKCLIQEYWYKKGFRKLKNPIKDNAIMDIKSLRNGKL